jgi:hypothetical protein
MTTEKTTIFRENMFIPVHLPSGRSTCLRSSPTSRKHVGGIYPESDQVAIQPGNRLPAL